MEADIAIECPRSKMLAGYAAMSSFEPTEVTAWLERIGVVGLE
jgi:hypothetical protein